MTGHEFDKCTAREPDYCTVLLLTESIWVSFVIVIIAHRRASSSKIRVNHDIYHHHHPPAIVPLDYTQQPSVNSSTNMSETTPLLPTSIRNQLPSASTIQNKLPSQSTRLNIAEAYGALSAGKAPSQQQISQIIDLALESDFLKASGGVGSKTARLGQEGTRVLESTKSVLEAIKAWGDEKNGDDVLQNLFYHSSHANTDIDLDIGGIDGPSAKATYSELGQDTLTTLKSLYQLVTVFLTSPASIHTLDHLVLLSRDLLSDGLSDLAENISASADAVKPSEKEKEKGEVDWNKAKDKGVEVTRHTATGLYKAQAKEKAIDKAIEGKHVCRFHPLLLIPSPFTKPLLLILLPFAPHSGSTKTSLPSTKSKTNSSPVSVPSLTKPNPLPNTRNPSERF